MNHAPSGGGGNEPGFASETDGATTPKPLNRDFVIELEIALLGACFNCPAVINDLLRIMDHSAFTEPLNARIFDAMVGRRHEGTPFTAGELRDLVRDLAGAEGPLFCNAYTAAISRPRVRPTDPVSFAAALMQAAHP